ncbi:MAG: VOC family protein [Pseudomonadota bacterium]
MSFRHSALRAIALTPVVLAICVPSIAQAGNPYPKPNQAVTGEPVKPRETVAAIGGVFFLADDPAALSAWYQRHFGINPVPTSYDDQPWTQESGPTIFAPFPKEGQTMIPEGKTWMINFRVSDLDAMAAQLTADGVEVSVDPTAYPNGRFATLLDPEGNPIQLWEPAPPE